MDTYFARNRLSAYLDGELNAAEARDVEAALARDPTLRRELDELRQAVDLLHESGIVEPPPGFSARLSARLAAEPMPVGWRRWVRTVRPEALMLAAAAILVVLYVGNHKELPDLAAPSEGLIAGKAFDKADPAPEVTAPDLTTTGSVEATPAAQAGPPAPGGQDALAAKKSANDAPSALGTSADGVLGNEGILGSSPKTSKSMPKLAGSNNSGEAEPWKADWENDPEYAAVKAPSASVGSAVAGSGSEVRWTSPPPFRYRVTASDDMALKKLAVIAKELGGELQDARGRPLAGFQLDAGDSNSVRVAVPAHNAAALAVRLREIGAVEALQESGSVLADPNADVPVAVTVLY